MPEPLQKSSGGGQQRFGFNKRRERWWWAQAHFSEWFAYSRGRFLFFIFKFWKGCQVYLAQNGSVPVTVEQLHRHSLNGWTDGQSFCESLLKHLMNSPTTWKLYSDPCSASMHDADHVIWRTLSYSAYAPVASALVIIPSYIPENSKCPRACVAAAGLSSEINT